MSSTFSNRLNMPFNQGAFPGCVPGRKTNLQETPLTPPYSTTQRRATTHENNTRAQQLEPSQKYESFRKTDFFSLLPFSIFLYLTIHRSQHKKLVPKFSLIRKDYKRDKTYNKYNNVTTSKYQTNAQ